jgi:hypothetical protein
VRAVEPPREALQQRLHELREIMQKACRRRAFRA